MTAYTEQAIREALDGHFYVMRTDPHPKVIDTLGDPEPRHPPRPWTDQDLAELWQLKRKGCTIEDIEAKTGRDRRGITQIWGRRRHWKDRVMAAAAPRARPDTVPLEEIRRAVCGYYMLGKQDFASTSRSKKTCEARQVLCWLARQFTGRSSLQIGQYAGGRDHSTVLYAIDKVGGNLADYRAAIEVICFDLGLELKAAPAVAA